MDTKVKALLEKREYENSFPPRDKVNELKSDLNRRGVLTSGMAIKQITEAYLECIEAVLMAFVHDLIRNSSILSISSETEMVDLVNTTQQTLFKRADSFLSQDLSYGGDDYSPKARTILYEKFDTIFNHLKGEITLSDLDLGQAKASVQVSGSQNVNILVGQIHGSIQQLIQHGTIKPEGGDLIKELLDIVSRMQEDNKKEQAELSFLIRGLTDELQKGQDERNPSMIQAALERIKTIGGTAVGAIELVQFVNDKLPLLFRALGFG